MYRFIAQKRYVRLMFSINGKNIRQLSKQVDMTTSHLSNVMDQFAKEGIIEKERKGREVGIKVTEKGKELIEILRKFEELAERQINKEEPGEKDEGENKVLEPS